MFPLSRNSKLPAIKNPHDRDSEEYQSCKGECGLDGHGLRDATTDINKIMQWSHKYKDCNWGVATGSESGVFVVDIDGPEGEQWFESLWLPEGAVVETPSGGKHLYYGYDGSVDLGCTVKKIHPEIDTRGNGGYTVLPMSKVDGKTYSGDLSEIPELPKSVIEIIPEKQFFSMGILPEAAEQVRKSSPQEQRVLKSIADRLDALPVPWVKGAGYHAVQFETACHLNRIANSPLYATDYDAALRLFIQHAPLRSKADSSLRDKRWMDAVKYTEGQWAEAPGDVPIRLDGRTELNNFPESTIERLYWDSQTIGDVKQLIGELRRAGADKQQAYSISYEARAMREIRKRNPDASGTTWGYVLKEYEEPGVADSEELAFTSDSPEARERPVILLSKEERDIVRSYPNYIDRYVATAQEMFDEPNMPLTYLNSWLALSSSLGDRARIYLKGKAVPLSLWGISTAGSAEGKGDAKSVYRQCISASRRGGFGAVSIGNDTSMEGLNAALMDRKGKVALLFVDEASTLLSGFKNPRDHFSKVKGLALDLYDGEAYRATRVGMAKDEIGEAVDVTFNMWLQTTWDQVTNILDISDIQSGLVGRFLVAIGDSVKITDQSLEPQFASQYQVSIGGQHPMARALGDSIRSTEGSYHTLHGTGVEAANREVSLRYVEARKAVLSAISGHPLEQHLKGVVLRVTENFLKGAALLALSEGRDKIEMEDLLLALKSGEYWVRDTLRLVDAISSGEYRRQVDHVAELVTIRPRTLAQILATPRFKNSRRFEVIEIVERAESEGMIRLDSGQGSGGKYVPAHEAR